MERELSLAGFGSPASGDAANEAEEEAPISGTRAARYQVVFHVEPETLAAESDAEPGRSELEDGTRVSAETSRRLACDAGLVSVSHGPGGSILDVGRAGDTPSNLRSAYTNRRHETDLSATREPTCRRREDRPATRTTGPR